MMAGAFMAAGGLYWLSFIQAGDNYWTGACGGGIMATFGMGLAFTPVALSATGGVRPDEAGLASGLVNSSRQIGASLGLAVLSTVVASHIAALLAGKAVTPELQRSGRDRRLSPVGSSSPPASPLAGGLLAFIIPRTVAVASAPPAALAGSVAGPDVPGADVAVHLAG